MSDGMPYPFCPTCIHAEEQEPCDNCEESGSAPDYELDESLASASGERPVRVVRRKASA